MIPAPFRFWKPVSGGDAKDPMHSRVVLFSILLLSIRFCPSSGAETGDLSPREAIRDPWTIRSSTGEFRASLRGNPLFSLTPGDALVLEWSAVAAPLRATLRILNDEGGSAKEWEFPIGGDFIPGKYSIEIPPEPGNVPFQLWFPGTGNEVYEILSLRLFDGSGRFVPAKEPNTPSSGWFWWRTGYEIYPMPDADTGEVQRIEVEMRRISVGNARLFLWGADGMSLPSPVVFTVPREGDTRRIRIPHAGGLDWSGPVERAEIVVSAFLADATVGNLTVERGASADSREYLYDFTNRNGLLGLRPGAGIREISGEQGTLSGKIVWRRGVLSLYSPENRVFIHPSFPTVFEIRARFVSSRGWRAGSVRPREGNLLVDTPSGKVVSPPLGLPNLDRFSDTRYLLPAGVLEGATEAILTGLRFSEGRLGSFEIERIRIRKGEFGDRILQWIAAIRWVLLPGLVFSIILVLRAIPGGRIFSGRPFLFSVLIGLVVIGGLLRVLCALGQDLDPTETFSIMPLDNALGQGARLLGGDGADYDRIALSLLEKGEFREGERRSFRAPLYPFQIAGIYALAGGRSLTAVSISQAFLGAISIVLVFGVAFRMGGWGAGLWSAFLLCFLDLHIVFTVPLFAEVQFVFLVLLGLLVAGGIEKRLLVSTAATGFCLSLAALSRPILLPVFPPFVLLLLLARVSWRRRFLSGAVFGVCFFAPILPFTYRNWNLHQAFVPISTNGGVNMLIANNSFGDYNLVTSDYLRGPRYDERSRGVYEESLSRNREKGVSLEAARDIAARAAAMDYMRSHPMDTLRKALKRVGHTVFLGSANDYDLLGIFRFPLVPWPFVGVLSVPGIFLALRRWKACRWAFAVLLPILFGIAFLVFTEKRGSLQLIPVLLPLAGLALQAATDRLGRGPSPGPLARPLPEG